MACTSCGKPKQFKEVKVTSTYTPQAGQATKFTDVILSFNVEKKPNNVSGQDKPNNSGA